MNIIGKLKDYVDSQDEILSLTPMEIAEDEKGAVSKAKAARLELLQDVQARKTKNHARRSCLTFRKVKSKTMLINAEFSYGRWNGDDVKALEEPLQRTVAHICLLRQLFFV